MKLVLISDTHGRCDDVLKSLVPVFNEADYLIHLGDGAGDLDEIANALRCRIIAVRGNNDYRSDADESEILTLPEGKILLTHGHRDGAHFGLLRLYYRAAENDCSYVFYGHTHRANVEIYNGVTFVNPGSLALPRGGRPSYATSESDRGQLISKIVFL